MTSIPTPDKFERRIERIENAISSIARIVRRNRLNSILIEYGEERKNIVDRVRSEVTLAETAMRELKDIIEDRKEDKK
ncbi:MAG: hypothetical protein HOB51_04125 [Thaumarchaeota archaeon]|nr:hypothetical protein [Nitrososphaerota archaeon]